MHIYIVFVILFGHYAFSSPLNETSTLSNDSLSNSTNPLVISPSNESGSTPSLPDSGDEDEVNHPKTFIPPANTSTVQPPNTLVQSQPALLSSTTTSGHTASKARPTILLSSTSTSYHASTAPTADSNPPEKAPVKPTEALGKSCVCSCNWEVNTHITFDFR